MDYLDKNNELFSLRLFREHCTKIEFQNSINYIKDLRIFQNVDLNDILIVDNSIVSFAFHMNNGIAILPYYDNKRDKELVYLSKYLDSIVNSTDLRQENMKYIKYIVDSSDSYDKFEDGKEVRSQQSIKYDSIIEFQESYDTSLVEFEKEKEEKSQNSLINIFK